MHKKALVLFTSFLLVLSGCNNGSKQKEHVHTYVSVSAVEATCTEDGNKAYYTCESCDKVFDKNKREVDIESVTIKALGHNLTHHDAHEAYDCTDHDNVEFWSCSRCGKNFADEQANTEIENVQGEAGDHHFVDYPAKEPTCLEDGNIACSYCTSCHKIFTADHQSEITDGSQILHKVPHDMTHHEAVLFENIEYWSCSICGFNYADPDGNTRIEDITDDSFQTHEILNNNVKKYLAATTDREIITALYNPAPYNDQVRKELRWNSNGSTEYIVEISNDLEFTNVKTITTNSTHITLPGTLIPGYNYYWRVKDNTGVYVTKINGFKVDYTYCVRTLNVPGVSNVRDAGGWTGKDGHQVKYGMIYRGGRLTNITDEGKSVLLDELGIKTEIDLRAGSDGIQELVDSRFAYNKCGFDQYTIIMPGYNSPLIEGRDNQRYGYNASTAPSLKQIFEILANKNNYPVYFHCNAGADRTGTLAYLINGLLGVSYDDLTKDFELTTFSAQGNRFRSRVSNFQFVTEGEYAGIYQSDTGNYVAWGKLNELMMAGYAQENGLLCSAIEYYLMKVCDVAPETIRAVRDNLLGNDVEFDPVEVKVDTTFTPLNGNMTLNSQVLYEKGTFFGKDAFKFYTTGTTMDHYIQNNLTIITNPAYTKFHFEVYVPSECAKWNGSSGPRFHFSIKQNGQSTNNIRFGDEITSDIPNTAYHVDIGVWTEFTFDISSYGSELLRYAFYLPYGNADSIGVLYLRNVYVD